MLLDLWTKTTSEKSAIRALERSHSPPQLLSFLLIDHHFVCVEIQQNKVVLYNTLETYDGVCTSDSVRHLMSFVCMGLDLATGMFERASAY